MNKVSSHFVARRLYSISGLLIGVFFLTQLYRQALILGPRGSQAFTDAVTASFDSPFHSLNILLFAALPFLYQAFYGLVLLYQGKSNWFHYPYKENIRYSLLRLTGLTGLLFLGYHLWFTWLFPLLAREIPDYLWISGLFKPFWGEGIYLVGGVALSYYLSFGLWNALIRWGVTPTQRSQVVSRVGCRVLFGVCAFIQVLVVAHFAYTALGQPAWLGAVLEFVKLFFFGSSS